MWQNTGSVSLSDDILACRRCPRLSQHLALARATHPTYHNRAVPGFGDGAARLLVVGLAPGFAGANRTGRPFTGDASGAWLYAALHALGLASTPASMSARDGLRLRGVYVTNAVKCVPPANRPMAGEVARCQSFLEREIGALPNLRAILALGRVAYASVRAVFGPDRDARPFAHGAVFRPRPDLAIVASYHPSLRNTNTGRLTWAAWTRAVRRAARAADLWRGDGARPLHEPPPWRKTRA